VKILFGWILQYCISGFKLHKSCRQVLTPVNNSQLLLKQEILDKLRLVTFHKNATQRKHKVLLVQTRSGEMGVLITLNHRASTLQCSPLKGADIFSLIQPKLWHFAAAVSYNVIITVSNFYFLKKKKIFSRWPPQSKQPRDDAGILSGVNVIKHFTVVIYKCSQ
jgi:hypothetical protein